jgi:RHS repeat-associated protein
MRSVILPDASNQPIVSQANDYFPFGMSFESTLPNPVIRANYNKLKYNGKEEQEMPGKWLDYGARFYDAQLGRWHGIDNKAEKYYFTNPYTYALNNPIVFIDPDGNEVIAHGKVAQRNILNTLPSNVRSSVKFKKDGTMTIRSSKAVRASTSGNLRSLQTLNNSDTKYHFKVTSEYTDGNGKTNKLVGDNDNGTKGVTLIPEGEAEPSPDSDVHIYTSESLSEERQATNTAHEAYGHGLSHEEGKDPYHRYVGVLIEYENGDYAIGREDKNTDLKEKYKAAELEAKENYNEGKNE